MPSGVRKKQNPLRRALSQSLINHPRRKPSQSPSSASNATKSNASSSSTPQKLPNEGVVSSASLLTALNPSSAPSVPSDLPQLLQHVYRTAFAEIPERASGMNSVRTAEVLRFRARLPPVVTVAHVLALSPSATSAERDIANLVAKGNVRRVKFAGRGSGRGGGEGEAIIRTRDWEEVVEQAGLGEELRKKYLTHLHHTPSATSSVSAPHPFTAKETTELIHTGLLTTVASAAETTLPVTSNSTSLSALSSAGSNNPSGTIAAVGGHDAFHSAGGGLSTPASLVHNDNRAEYALSLPNTGPLLKLLSAARLHMLELLKKLSPRYREAPLSSLHERWDGGVDLGKKGLLPGRTRRWREFHGLNFEWMLAECVGMGVVECFDTGSVGLAVRAT